MHQAEYARSFGDADVILLAPLGRAGLSESERLDTARLSEDLTRLGKKARAFDAIDPIVSELSAEARPGDVIALLSNGAFGGIREKLLRALGTARS
jgi:UDP-N-acetylmuramate: L-alanyl-gamma-D-glutamyl-meso-diaminopimelate ligase